MFGSDVLEVAIGLMLVYFLLALICSALNEWIARAVALRADTLESGIRTLLADEKLGGEDLAVLLYAHPLIAGLSKKGKPSYVSSRAFALALFDTVAPVDRKAGAPTLQAIRDQVLALPPGQLRQALLIQIDDAKGDLDRARDNVETWFDNSMERVSGWYKRKVQLILLVLALLVTCGLNVDTLAVGASLNRDATLRAAVTAAVSREVAGQAANPQSSTPLTEVIPLQQELGNLGLPIGWSAAQAMPSDGAGWLAKIVGLLVTTIAVSLGAPFWFDLLNRVTNLRAAGEKPG